MTTVDDIYDQMAQRYGKLIYDLLVTDRVPTGWDPTSSEVAEIRLTLCENAIESLDRTPSEDPELQKRLVAYFDGRMRTLMSELKPPWEE